MPITPKKELKYFIRMFKLEGHQTWRITMEPNLDNIKGKIIEKKVVEINRITGEIKTQ